jgi:hypothetical protein
MSVLDQVLNWAPLSRTRRNHALEHATLQVLAEKNTGLRAGGYSDHQGFWLMGDIETHKVEEAVHEALSRLRGGEHSLAIHPHCGTNLVASGFLAGSLGWIGMLGANRHWRDRMERWPLVISLVTVGLMLAQPLGPFLQARYTTLATAPGLEVVSIQRVQRGKTPLHRVLTHS